MLTEPTEDGVNGPNRPPERGWCTDDPKLRVGLTLAAENALRGKCTGTRARARGDIEQRRLKPLADVVPAAEVE